MTVPDAIVLIASYHYSPRLSPLLEAAKFEVLMGRLAQGLSTAARWALCERLHLRVGRGIKAGLILPLTILRNAIDRRPALKIPKVSPSPEQTYRSRGGLPGDRRVVA